MHVAGAESTTATGTVRAAMQQLGHRARRGTGLVVSGLGGHVGRGALALVEGRVEKRRPVRHVHVPKVAAGFSRQLLQPAIAVLAPRVQGNDSVGGRDIIFAAACLQCEPRCSDLVPVAEPFNRRLALAPPCASRCAQLLVRRDVTLVLAPATGAH